MMKRREFISRARRPAWPLAEHAQQAANGFLKAHRRVHSGISLRHSAMSCVSPAGPTAETINLRRSRRKLDSGTR